MADSILLVLISIESIVLALFCILVLIYNEESLLEVILFLTVVAGEGVLGLVLIILKVGVSSLDYFRLENVF